MHLSRKLRLLLILSGLIVIALAAVAQMSSVLTPSLARYPLFLSLFGSLGMNLIFLTGLVYFSLAIRLGQRLFLFLAVLCLSTFLFTLFSLLGRVFQFSLFGLTVGGSLLLLGSMKAISTKSSS